MKLIFVLLFTFAHSALAQQNLTSAGETPSNLGFHHESELGYIVVGGNAKSESFSGRQGSWYQWDRDILKLTGHYLSSKAQNQQTRETEGTAENWSAALRAEHIYVPDKFNVFLQAGASGDRFVGVSLGMAYDIGAKYFWISGDRFQFFTELGYRYLHEDLERNNVQSELESHFIRLFNQVDYMVTDSIKFGLWVEYLPDLKNDENYRLNFSPYMLAILSDVFSLKFGYEGFYRNVPVPVVAAGPVPFTPERLDFRHVTALIAKF